MEKISTFRERLKEAMNDANLSQSELARMINCHRSKISYYLNGRNESKPDTLRKLAKILDVSSEWLEGYDVPRKTVKQSEYFQEKLNRLTDEGKRKVEEYIDDLLDNPKYNKVPAVSLPPKLPKIA